MRQWMFAALLTLLSLPAPGAVICSGCEYDEGSVATELGSYDPATFDLGTFQHTGVPLGDPFFVDLWTFELLADARGSISADFTAFAALDRFAARLFEFSSGDLVAIASDTGDSRWELLLDRLAAGLYVLAVSGIANPVNGGAYTGQLAFTPILIGEGSTFWLAIFGLLLLIGARYVQRNR